MKPEIKDQIVKALRSGEYKQGTGRLKIGTTFCCLGVICDLYSKETGTSWDTTNKNTFLGAEYALPELVTEWAGLSFRDPVLDNVPQKERPMVPNNEVSSHLSSANDCGASFNTIADWFEKGYIK